MNDEYFSKDQKDNLSSQDYYLPNFLDDEHKEPSVKSSDHLEIELENMHINDSKNFEEQETYYCTPSNSSNLNNFELNNHLKHKHEDGGIIDKNLGKTPDKLQKGVSKEFSERPEPKICKSFPKELERSDLSENFYRDQYDYLANSQNQSQMYSYPNNQANLPITNNQVYLIDCQKQYYNMNNNNLINSNNPYLQYNQMNPNTPNNINQIPMYQNNYFYNNNQTHPKVLQQGSKFMRHDYNTDHRKNVQGLPQTHINTFNINTNNKIFYNCQNPQNTQNPVFNQPSFDGFNINKAKLTNSGNFSNNFVYNEIPSNTSFDPQNYGYSTKHSKSENLNYINFQNLNHNIPMTNNLIQVNPNNNPKKIGSEIDKQINEENDNFDSIQQLITGLDCNLHDFIKTQRGSRY